jgi:cyclopropane fatty-acyl-phospholipid synthase-like methyltransferase
MIKNFKCVCCGNTKCNFHNYNNYGYKLLSDENNLFNDLNILCCNICGFAHASPLLEENKITDFYRRFYSSKGTIHSVSWESNFRNSKKKFSPRAFAQINLLRAFIDFSKLNNVLEIGPGEGSIAKLFKLMGIRISYHVYEEDLSCIKRLKKLNSIFLENTNGLFLNNKYLDKFDITIMSHSLEHFQYNQILFILRNVYKMTRKDGLFLIEVPCENFNKSSLHENHSPHLSFFTIEAFRNLIKKTGFQIVYISEVGPNRSTLIKNENKFKENFRKYKLFVTIYKFLMSVTNLINILLGNLYFRFFSNSMELIKSSESEIGTGRVSIRCLLCKNETN